MPATSDRRDGDGARVGERLGSGLLRLATAGSVDDGKSTLIGRLLYDSRAILADQLEQVELASQRRGGATGNGGLDLALVTDGLRAEREQGITIDVAYRYFATARRSFILADTPGHVQYTRNMVTGASTADLAILLVDARHGVVEQTRRHAFIATLLRIPRLVLAVNKMDLIGYDEARFDAICADFRALRPPLGLAEVTAIPISALAGANVVHRSPELTWYRGPSLLEHLETVPAALPGAAGNNGGARVADPPLDGLRFPVQWVIRDHESGYRGYAGQIAGGVLRPGDEVVVLPSGARARVASVELHGEPLDAAVAGQSVTVRLTDDVDVARGDLLTDAASAPPVRRELVADVCWLAEAPLRPGGRLAIKHTTASARAIVDELLDVVDIATLARRQGPSELVLNDIGRIRLRSSRPLAPDRYERNRTTGAFILIDEATNDTVAAGFVR